jgi:hypothetical protein
MTGQVFHSLGFYWARHSGMFEIGTDTMTDIPSSDDPEAEKVHRWKLWAAREIQLRAVLGHYVLDGQISQFSGDPTCARHAANPLGLPSSDSAFEASTVDDWIAQMNAAGQHQTSFRAIFSSMFYTPNVFRDLDKALSSFSICILLEGLKSLILEDNEAAGPAIGIPSRHDICRTLGHLYGCIKRNTNLSTADRSEALIRWHAISLDLATESTQLCRKLCHQLSIKQNIFGGAKKDRYTFDAKNWVNAIDARRALLHAVAIQEVAEGLPIGRSRAIHIPSSLFAAATVYCAFALAGASVLTLPYIAEWENVMALEMNSIPSGPLTPNSGTGSEIKDFLYGIHPPTEAPSMTRNILYDLNLLQMFLHFSSQQWGVCSEMEKVLEQWISLCT